MKIFTFALILAGLVGFNTAQAQGCSSGRYVTRNMFTAVQTDTNVVYGSNTTVGDTAQQVLKLNVFQPQADTQPLRPAVIFAFGGSFITGNKGDVASLCRAFAGMGYVTIAPDYRTGSFSPNQVNTTLAVVRATHDLKAVIRFLKKSVAENGNPYKIDTNAIVVGGVSAGAIAAIHAAYLNKDTEFPSYLTGNDTVGLGGIEGVSGNPGYSSSVAAVVSYSGAIGDTMWISHGDVPLFMVHDTTDPTVPFYTQEVSVQGFPTGLIASGDGSINNYLNRIGGVEHQLVSYNNGWHVDYLGAQATFDTTVAQTARFLVGSHDNICLERVGITEVAVDDASFTVYPNPTEGKIAIKNTNGKAYNLNVYNTLGQVVYNRNQVSDMNTTISLNVEPGFYIVKMTNTTNNATLATEKLIVR